MNYDVTNELRVEWYEGNSEWNVRWLVDEPPQLLHQTIYGFFHPSDAIWLDTKLTFMVNYGTDFLKKEEQREWWIHKWEVMCSDVGDKLVKQILYEVLPEKLGFPSFMFDGYHKFSQRSTKQIKAVSLIAFTGTTRKARKFLNGTVTVHEIWEL